MFVCGRKLVQQVVRDVLSKWVNIWTCACVADRDLESGVFLCVGIVGRLVRARVGVGVYVRLARFMFPTCVRRHVPSFIFSCLFLLLVLVFLSFVAVFFMICLRIYGVKIPPLQNALKKKKNSVTQGSSMESPWAGSGLETPIFGICVDRTTLYPRQQAAGNGLAGGLGCLGWHGDKARDFDSTVQMFRASLPGQILQFHKNEKTTQTRKNGAKKKLKTKKNQRNVSGGMC